jgi:hypothetical protein
MTFLFFKVFVRWLRRRASAALARMDRDRLVFSASGVKTVYGIGMVLALAVLMALLESEPLWTAAFPAVFFGLFLYFWPADVVLDHHSIVQHYWWGKNVRIGWRDVASIVHRVSDGTTFVFGFDGTEIEHTGFHSDPLRFLAEVKDRAAIPDITDWDAVPSLIAAAR